MAKRPTDIEAARLLFREYRQWHVDHQKATAIDDAALRLGLSYLDAEIESLPGEYSAPRAALLVAFEDGSPVGCGALRELRLEVAEIKRVYVRPSSRGCGLGRKITQALMARARTWGYDRVVLDTLPAMTSAIFIYRGLGFVPTEPYWAHPVSGALFFEYRFRDRAPRSATNPVELPS